MSDSNTGLCEATGEELEPEQIQVPELEPDTLDGFYQFREDFYNTIKFNGASEQDKVMRFKECLKGSKSKAFLVLDHAEQTQPVPDLDTALTLVETFFKKEKDMQSYLDDKKSLLEKTLDHVNNGEMTKNNLVLNGIAFPLMLKLLDAKGERFLPAFLTCAHCAKKKGASEYKPFVILTPSNSLNLKESFVFDLDSRRIDGIFGCKAKDTAFSDSSDFLVLFLKDKENEKKEQIKSYWLAEKEVKEGDRVNMATSHDNHNNQSPGHIPVIQEGKVANIPALINGDLVETVALHDIVGISGISGECLYAVDTDKFECRLMFRGKLEEHVPEYMPPYIGLPIACVTKELKESKVDLSRFWYSSKAEIPSHVKTGGFVESYLVLIQDEQPHSAERESANYDPPSIPEEEDVGSDMDMGEGSEAMVVDREESSDLERKPSTVQGSAVHLYNRGVK